MHYLNMALIDKASLLMVPSTYEEGTLYNVLPSGNRAPDSTDQNSGYDQTRADFTFDRGSNAAATRVNSDGLIEKYRENLLLQSNQFNTTWSNNRSYETSGQSDPDGGNNAWWFREDANTGTHILQQNVTPSSGVYTGSIIAKAKERSGVQFLIEAPSSYGFANFDLTDGSVVSSGDLGNVTLIDSGSVSLGNGWYKLRITIHSSVSLSWFKCYLLNSSFQTSYAGVDGNGIYLYQAQLETSMVATDYLDSGATTAKAGVLIDLPRINYDANGENGALLLEPSRQQLIQYSEMVTISVTNVGYTATENDTTSPEGVVNAGKLLETTGTTHLLQKTFSVGSTTDSYAVSFFVKGIGRTLGTISYELNGAPYNSVSATFNLSNVTITDAVATGTGAVAGKSDIEPMGNDWYRVTLSGVLGITGTHFVRLFGRDDSGNNSYVGDPTKGFNVYGFQAELGSYATSYIPNMGESGGVTRAADSCSVTGVSDVIGQTEGTIYLDIQTPDAIQSNTTFSIGGGTSSEYAQLEIRTDLSINWRYRVGGTDYINANVGSYSAGDRLKLAFGYKNGDSILYLNGSSIATDTGSITSNSWDEVKYSNFANTGKLEASVYETTLFIERLTNSELATLTTL